MSKSSIILNNDGSLDMVLGQQVELTNEEKQDLQKMERGIGQLMNAETLFKKESHRLEIALLNVPDYQKLMKLREKTKTVRDMTRKAKIVLDAKYEEVFQNRGMQQTVDLYLNQIPDTVSPAKKRGRPKQIEGGK